MTTNTQIKNMNAYIEAFIAEHGSEDMVETWQDDENQTEFMKLAKKMNKGKKATSPKDPNKPKRGKSAYLFFCADNRAKTKEDLGDDAKATEVTAELGKRWNELKESDSKIGKKKMEKYEQQAKEDKERYETEMADYEPPSEEELEAMTKGKRKSKKSSGKKDPNKPKRGKSAYLFFCADNRAKTKEDLGDDAKATEVTAELGRLWNELKESDSKSDKKKMEKYEKQSKEDKERYEAEMVDYEPPSDAEGPAKKKKKSSGKKDPNKPKRGKSAYLFFCADNRAKTKEDLGDDAKATEVTAELGRLWNELKDSDKKSDKKKMEKYEKQAKEDKERYETEMADYEPPSEEKEDDDEIVEDEGVEDEGVEEKKEDEVVADDDDEDEIAEMEELRKMVEANKKVAKKSVKKSEKKSEKKTTGYSLFCKQYREDVKEEHPDEKTAEITKILAGMWKELPKEEQEEWKHRASAM